MFPHVAFVLCFSFVKQELGLFVLSTRTRSVNLSFCCAIPKCRIQRTRPNVYQKAVWWCRSACMIFVFIYANYSDAFVQSSLWCSSIWWYTTRQETPPKKTKLSGTQKEGWCTSKSLSVTVIHKSSWLAPSESLLFLASSCSMERHKTLKKNQTLRECSCYINVCSSGWVVQWLDLLLFSNIVR